MEILAQRLKELREERNYTLRKLGNILGIDHKTYWHYEQGSTYPKPEVLVTLAKLYGVPTDYLLGLVEI